MTTNDASSPKAILTCVGSVKVPFNLNPKTVSFGRIARDAESVSKIVTITRGDGGPLSLELMPPTARDKGVTATLTEVEAGEMYELEIVAEPPWPNTSVRANVRLKTGVAEAPMESVRVYGMVTPRLAAAPNRLHIPPGKKEELDVETRLVWAGGKPGNIVEATTSDKDTSVRVEERDGQQYVVMHVPAGYTPARGRAYVTLKTDDPAAPSLRIPVYAQTTRQAARPRVPVRRPAVPRTTGVTAGAPARAKPPTAKPPTKTPETPE